jgi:hypothetical protein
VYLWTPNGDTPDNYVIRGSVRDNGIVINSGENYIEVENIEVVQQRKDCVQINYANYVKLKNNTFRDCDSIAINSPTANNCEISNNYISGANHYGIFAYLSDSLIENNTLEDISLFNNLGRSGSGRTITLASVSGKAIHVEGANNIFRGQRIERVGYSGIAFYGLNNLVEFNYVKDTCLDKDDGSGIYTYGGVNPLVAINAGSIIRNNIVDGCFGNIAGYTYARPHSAGIYLDDNSGDILVQNNIIKNVGICSIFLHNCRNISVENTQALGGEQVLLISGDNGSNTINGNIFVARKGEELIHEYICSDVHNYNNNQYISVDNDNIFVDTQTWDASPDVDSYNFAQWKTQSGQDAASTIFIPALTSRESIDIYYNETNAPLTYHLNGAECKDVDMNPITTSFVVAPFQSKIVIGSSLNLIARTEQVSTLNLETLQYISGLVTPLSTGKLNKVDTFVSAMKTVLGTSNLATSIDFMYLLRNSTQEVALRNVVKPMFDAISSGANKPIFTADSGIKGQGADSYLDPNFFPETSAVAMSNNSISFVIGVSVKNANTSGVHGANSTTADGGGANGINMACAGSDFRTAKLNGGSSTVSSPVTAPCLIVATRTSSGNMKVYVNKIKVLDTSNTVTKPPNQKLLLLATYMAAGTISQFVQDEIDFAMLGRGLTQLEVEGLVDAWNEFKYN